MSRSRSLLLLLLSFFLSLLTSTTAHGGSDDGNTITSDMNNDHQNLHSKPLILVKIWCLILIFVGTFIGGVSPYFLKCNEGFLVFGTQFAGGVFLGSALMHFLSNANETFEDLTSVQYPFPFMSACAGFLLAMLADCVVSYLYGTKKDVSNGDMDHQDFEEEKWNEGLLVLWTQQTVGVFLGSTLMHFLSYGNETFGDLTSVAYPFAFMLACAGYLLTMLADSVVPYVYGKKKVVSNGDLDHQGNGTHSHFQAHNGTYAHSANSSLATASALGDIMLLIIAFGFHSVFKGITEIKYDAWKDNAWKALWTISLHKVFATIAMGIPLLRMMPHRPLLSCTAYAFAFAILSPIGMAIGFAINATTRGPVADCIFAISMGIAYISREK